ncbi:MAG: hypothetical protein NVSMB22_19810 [Chloroflexota bacterium]
MYNYYASRMWEHILHEITPEEYDMPVVHEDDVSMGHIAVDFLYSDDCPSHERALQLVREVIEETGVEARITIQQVESEEDAHRLAFPGSPTIRVAGRDIDDIDESVVGLTCRAYRHSDGRISPLPSKEKISSAVRRVVADAESRLSA